MVERHNEDPFLLQSIDTSIQYYGPAGTKAFQLVLVAGHLGPNGPIIEHLDEHEGDYEQRRDRAMSSLRRPHSTALLVPAAA